MGFEPYRRLPRMSMQMLDRLAVRRHACVAHLAYPKNRLRLRLVIRAHDHLAQKPDRNELHTDDPEENCQEDDGASAQANAEHEPLEAELGREAEARERECEADQPEELDRPCGVARQKFDRQEIEHHARAAADPPNRPYHRATTLEPQQGDQARPDVRTHRSKDMPELTEDP